MRQRQSVSWTLFRVLLPRITINEAEIAHFSRLSSEWWDEHGEFGFLHKMNPARMELIREKLLALTAVLGKAKRTCCEAWTRWMSGVAESSRLPLAPSEPTDAVA